MLTRTIEGRVRVAHGKEGEKNLEGMEANRTKEKETAEGELKDKNKE